MKRDKLRGMKMPKKRQEMEDEELMMELDDLDMEGLEDEGMEDMPMDDDVMYAEGEEVTEVAMLDDVSDDDLLAEIRRRGLSMDEMEDEEEDMDDEDAMA